MKTLNSYFTKSLCLLVMAFASFLTASAEVEYVIVNGFIYELNSDPDDPWGGGTATLFDRDCQWYTDSLDEWYMEYYSIEYEDWNTDSIFYVPSMIGSYPVTCINGGFGGFSDIKTVYIPPTVTRLGRNAFANSSLESIYFIYDGDYNHTEPITFEENHSSPQWNSSQFRNCKRLSRVVFQRPFANISSFMFADCPRLKSVYCDDSYFAPEEMSVDTIGEYAFFNCDSLTHFEIPNSVKVIDEGAFAYCCNLKTINIPDCITSIGDYTFAECHQLQGITLKPSLQSIGQAAFINCHSLTNLDIPDAITTIKGFTFYDCRNLINLNLNNVTTFGERSFAGCNKLTGIDLTKAQDIGEGAFLGGKVFCSVWDQPTNYGHPYISIAYREEQWSFNEGSFKKITLGNDVSVLNDATFAGHVPDTITCMAPLPPTYSRTDGRDLVFSNDAYANSVLCVPQILVNDYREAYGWSRFLNIQGMTIMGSGDVNTDGLLDITDITILIDVLLTGHTDASNLINSDLNGDGIIDISDVVNLIDRVLRN